MNKRGLFAVICCAALAVGTTALGQDADQLETAAEQVAQDAAAAAAAQAEEEAASAAVDDGVVDEDAGDVAENDEASDDGADDTVEVDPVDPDTLAEEAATEAAALEAAAADAGAWNGAFGVSSSFNLAHINYVPGAPNGLSVGVNVSADGVLDYVKGKHEWRNTLTLNAGALKSASDAFWLKTNDVLALDSGYYYAVKDWFGPFASVHFRTSMFPLYLVGENPSFVDEDGNPMPEFVGGSSALATKAFNPLQMEQKFGLFFRPVDEQKIRLSFRTGFAGQEFVVNNNAYMELERNDNVVTMRPLDSYALFGYFADASLRGFPEKENILYGADASVLVPIAAKEGDYGVQGNLSAFATFKFNQWASLDVRAAAAYIPQVTGDKWQTTIQTLLTFSYAVVGDVDTAREDAGELRHVIDGAGESTGSLEAPDM